MFFPGVLPNFARGRKYLNPFRIIPFYWYEVTDSLCPVDNSLDIVTTATCRRFWVEEGPISTRQFALARGHRCLAVAGATAIGLVLASCESLPTQGLGAGDTSTQPTTDTEVKISDSFVAAARASESAGDYVGAAGYWQNLLDREPSDLEAAVGLADNLRRLGQYGYAINVLNDALSYHSDDPRLLSLLGRTLVADGNATAALDPLQRSAEIEPGMWETQAALAVAYGMLGELARSNEANMRALAASPDNPKVLNNMGLQAAMQGDLDGAIELLERASRADEADSKIRLNLALLLAYRGDIDRAEGLVREELSADEAEQNIAFFRSLAGNDLQNLEELVARSNYDVEAQPLPPVEEGESLASNQPNVVVEPVESSTQIVEPVEEVVTPAAEIVATQPAPDAEMTSTETSVQTPESDVVTMTYDDEPQDLPATQSTRESDEFVLPPETIVTRTSTEETVVEPVQPIQPVEVVETPPEVDPEPVPEPASTEIDTTSSGEDNDVSILEMIGSITAPTPEAGAGENDGVRSNSRDDDLPTDNAFDFEYFQSSEETDPPSND